MANLSEIAEAIETARQAGCREILLLRCVSGYPTPVEESNLRTIGDLAVRFGLPVGLSDHTLGIGVPVAAVALGAVAIEKHMTLDRRDGGVDAAFSLEPQELAALVKSVREAWAALGDVSYARAPSEAASAAFRRSIYVVRDVAAGETFTVQNLRVIRPGHGMAPRELPRLIGRRAARALARGTALAPEMVEGWQSERA
jgi:N-acetylneuraminate synthase